METTARTGGFFIANRRMAEKMPARAGSEDVMDEKELEQQQPEVEEEPQGAEIDWKAESRKWEKRAKEHKEAAEELERIKAERMSETERLQARAEKAEAELSKLAKEKERAESAAEVAKKTSVPQDLLAFCADKEAMEAFAEVYNAHMAAEHVPAAPAARKSRIVRESNTPISNRDVFAEMVDNLI